MLAAYTVPSAGGKSLGSALLIILHQQQEHPRAVPVRCTLQPLDATLSDQRLLHLEGEIEFLF